MATTIGGNIKAVRETLGYSQLDVARKVKAHYSTISVIESGSRAPSFAMLLRIKRALGCDWNALLRGIA